jgi:WhiB family transcriptional regulator, redox-sensing transcriptional regulator
MTHVIRKPLFSSGTSLRPMLDEWSWQEDAACRAVDPELFFHPDNERGRARRRRARAAKSICNNCAVIDACRAFAIRTRQPFGVWGGISEDERDDVRAEVVGVGS